jgi:hypothetical protein
VDDRALASHADDGLVVTRGLNVTDVKAIESLVPDFPDSLHVNLGKTAELERETFTA